MISWLSVPPTRQCTASIRTIRKPHLWRSRLTWMSFHMPTCCWANSFFLFIANYVISRLHKLRRWAAINRTLEIVAHLFGWSMEVSISIRDTPNASSDTQYFIASAFAWIKYIHWAFTICSNHNLRFEYPNVRRRCSADIACVLFGMCRMNSISIRWKKEKKTENSLICRRFTWPVCPCMCPENPCIYQFISAVT